MLSAGSSALGLNIGLLSVFSLHSSDNTVIIYAVNGKGLKCKCDPAPALSRNPTVSSSRMV
jgi:hypothetical protein